MDPIDDHVETVSGSVGASADMHARISGALARIGICVRTVGQYGRSHPMIGEMVAGAHQALVELLVVQPTVAVAVVDNYLALESFPIDDKSGCLSGLAGLLSQRKVTEIRLTSGITRGELIEFAEVMYLAPENILLMGGIAAEFERRQVTHIRVSTGVLPTEFRQAKDPADIYEDALILVEDALRAVQSGLAIPVPEIRAVVADSLQNLLQEESALLALTGIRSYDRYLSEHSVNVCILSMVLGRDLGLDTASTLELGISGLLHDVGKVFVPQDIVGKPGRLSEEEWQQIRRHPGEGARALAGLADLPALASAIALEHHVRADGTGYPSLPPNYRPHLLSRLIAIVDTYDALTTDRPYRARWTAQQAIAWMLYEEPGRYDRQLLARFAARARLYPLGSLVKLTSGDHAIVVSGSFDHPRLPTLRIIGAEKSGAPREIDLAAGEDPGLRIESMAQPVEVLLPFAERLEAA